MIIKFFNEVSLVPGSADEYPVWKPVPRIVLSVLTGTAYFFVGVAGGKLLISYENGIPWYVYMDTAAMALVDALALDGMFRKHVKKPMSYTLLIKGLAVLGGLSALSFYTGARSGARLLAFSTIGAEVLATAAFSLRAYTRVISILLCRDQALVWAEAIKKRNYLEIMQMFLAVTIGVFIMLFSTDPLLAAVEDIGGAWFKLEMNNYPVFSYTMMGLVATTGFPSYCIWSNMGLQRIKDNFKVAKTPKGSFANRCYILLAMGLSLLLYLPGTLGSASSPQGEAFSALMGGLLTFILKIVFLSCYSILAPLGGMNTLLRATYTTAQNSTKYLGSFCFKPGESLVREPLPVPDLSSLTIEEGKNVGRK